MNQKRKMLWLGNLSLLIVLAYLGLRVVGVLEPVKSVTEPLSAQATEQNGETESPSSNDAQPDYHVIVQHDLFGTAAQQTKSSAVSGGPRLSVEAPVINLKLCGTVAGPDSIARALIREPDSAGTMVYRIGDTVQGGELVKIDKDSVVLRFSGREVVLRLEVTGGEAEKPNENTATERVNDSLEAASSPKLMEMEARQKEGMVEHLFRQAQMTPYVKDNQVEGLKISDIEDIAIAKLIGLKEGDVVCRVNGQATTDKQKAYQVLKKGRSQSSLEIELLRDNKKKNLSVPLGW